MSICWFCHWGWPKPIYDIYKEALDALGGVDWCLVAGPSHVVWSDENFDLAQSCLDDFDEDARRYLPDATKEELNIVRKSLEKLLAVDDKYKDWPEEYDGESPQNFPPPDDWEMVKP
jgi:hypothetical protein